MLAQKHPGGGRGIARFRAIYPSPRIPIASTSESYPSFDRIFFWFATMVFSVA